MRSADDLFAGRFWLLPEIGVENPPKPAGRQKDDVAGDLPIALTGLGASADGERRTAGRQGDRDRCVTIVLACAVLTVKVHGAAPLLMT